MLSSFMMKIWLVKANKMQFNIHSVKNKHVYCSKWYTFHNPPKSWNVSILSFLTLGIQQCMFHSFVSHCKLYFLSLICICFTPCIFFSSLCFKLLRGFINCQVIPSEKMQWFKRVHKLYYCPSLSYVLSVENMWWEK